MPIYDKDDLILQKIIILFNNFIEKEKRKDLYIDKEASGKGLNGYQIILPMSQENILNENLRCKIYEAMKIDEFSLYIDPNNIALVLNYCKVRKHSLNEREIILSSDIDED